VATDSANAVGVPSGERALFGLAEGFRQWPSLAIYGSPKGASRETSFVVLMKPALVVLKPALSVMMVVVRWAQLVLVSSAPFSA